MLAKIHALAQRDMRRARPRTNNLLTTVTVRLPSVAARDRCYAGRMLARSSPLIVATAASCSALGSRDAHAQTRLPAMRVPPIGVAAERTTPRVRFGIGLHGGYARYGATPIPAIIGAYLRLGAQITERFALEAQASAVPVLGYYVRANLYSDFTLNSWVSVAVSPLWSQGYYIGWGGSTVGASARLTLVPMPQPIVRGVRSGIAISLEADAGITVVEGCSCPPSIRPSSGNFSWGLFVSGGYLRF